MEVEHEKLGYHQKYYLKHREKVLAKRKDRYRTDSEYRERAIARSRAWYIKNRDAGRRVCRPDKDRRIFIPVHGKKSVEAFRIGVLAKALGRRVETLLWWERNGILPKATHRTASNWRLYTKDQIDVAVSVARQIEIDRACRGNPRIGEFGKLLHLAWGSMPGGTLPPGFDHEALVQEKVRSQGSP